MGIMGIIGGRVLKFPHEFQPSGVCLILGCPPNWRIV